MIKVVFLQADDGIIPHVQKGPYDLTGPNGEIIHPFVWDEVIEPGWAITMTMRPLDKTPSVNNFLSSPTTRPKLTPFGPAQDSKSKMEKGAKRKSDKKGPRPPISRLANGSNGDAENSDVENSDVENSDVEISEAERIINTASKKLNEIDDELRWKWIPLCIDYIHAPPKDPKKREDVHRDLFENILQQVILKLDAVETEGILEIRQRRKELVRDTQEVLKRLDFAKASWEAEGEDTAEMPKGEEKEEGSNESEKAARV